MLTIFGWIIFLKHHHLVSLQIIHRWIRKVWWFLVRLRIIESVVIDSKEYPKYIPEPKFLDERDILFKRWENTNVFIGIVIMLLNMIISNNFLKHIQPVMTSIWIFLHSAFLLFVLCFMWLYNSPNPVLLLLLLQRKHLRMPFLLVIRMKSKNLLIYYQDFHQRWIQ